jgi:hypothetical protein
MLKIIVSLLLAQLVLSSYLPSGNALTANCPIVANLHKSGGTGSTITIVWDAVPGTAQYKVWWVRKEDNCLSTQSLTPETTLTFTNLAAGNYTFYVETVCNGEASGWVGIEECITG